jgi:acetate---CoA ligase (ADP-forming)
LKQFFEPETVALIGASANTTRPGYHLFSNINAGFGDKFYPVNPKIDTIEHKRCYPTILDVPADIDVAVVFIPARLVPEALSQCAQKNISRVIIESGGFAETGPEGRETQRQCLEIAHKANMRLWGPNCMGLINVTQRKVLSFMRANWRGNLSPGPVSLVVQSGMLSAGFLAYFVADSPFGLSKIASIGNKMDVGEIDVLDYLITDPDTGVIALYLESLDRGRRFFELARSTDKPIIVLKAGRSEMGAQAAWSHTASLAQNDRVVDAAFRQSGVIRVYDFNELFDVARALGTSTYKKRAGDRVAIVTFSGGAAVLASDALSDHGMHIAKLSDETIDKMQEVFPEWMKPVNPLDLYPAIERSGFARAIQQAWEAAIDDPGVDAVYAHIVAGLYRDLPDFQPIIDRARSLGKPIVVWTMGDRESVTAFRAKLEALGVPVVKEISRGVRVLAALTVRR